MCLIVAKPKGVCLPEYEKMEEWFVTHPDGFGLAFRYGGRVRILKGAMTVEQIFPLLAMMQAYLGKTKPRDVDIIFHFRQATNGQAIPANCHPFPLTKEESAQASLDTLTACAIAHNGMIWSPTILVNNCLEGYGDYAEGIGFLSSGIQNIASNKTDTQEFIEEYMVGLGESLWNPTVQKLIEAYTNSKFALLSKRGITLIGKFIKEDGYWYSNGGYKPAATSIIQLETLCGQAIDENSCDGCGAYDSSLYYGPDDTVTKVCYSCFQVFYNRRPEAEELVMQYQK